MHILFGIGNPGSRYEITPHNVGFMMVNSLSDSTQWKSEKNALTQSIIINQNRILLAKPMTYVNLCGQTAFSLLSFYKLPPEALIVVTDDVNLGLGAIRIRLKGSDGGHKGLRDLIKHCGPNFIRIRIGVGYCPQYWDLSRFVLTRFSMENLGIIREIEPILREIIESGLTAGWDKTAAQYNRKSPLDA
jgi:PTH1 family peptidyl-tRNA hydrolase